jgi:hypothetical protein
VDLSRRVAPVPKLAPVREGKRGSFLGWWLEASHQFAGIDHEAMCKLEDVVEGDKEARPRRGRSRCAPGHTGHHHATADASQTDTTPETGQQHNQ